MVWLKNCNILNVGKLYTGKLLNVREFINNMEIQYIEHRTQKQYYNLFLVEKRKEGK